MPANNANQTALSYSAFVEMPAYTYSTLKPGTELEPIYLSTFVPAAWNAISFGGMAINASSGTITGNPVVFERRHALTDS